MTEAVKSGRETSVGGALEFLGNVHINQDRFAVTYMVAELLAEQGFSFQFKPAHDLKGAYLPDMIAIWTASPQARSNYEAATENPAVRSLISLSHPTVLPKPSDTKFSTAPWTPESAVRLDALYFHLRAKGFRELAHGGQEYRDKIKEALDERDRLLGGKHERYRVTLPDYEDVKQLVSWTALLY